MWNNLENLLRHWGSSKSHYPQSDTFQTGRSQQSLEQHVGLNILVNMAEFKGQTHCEGQLTFSIRDLDDPQDL